MPLVADGVVLAVVDAWFDDVGLAWEIDSYEYHLSPSSYAATLARHAVLTAHGVVVLHTLPSRLHREPRRVLDELCGSYEQAAPPSTPVPRRTDGVINGAVVPTLLHESAVRWERGGRSTARPKIAA